MAHPKTLNLLLVEDNLEDEHLIREALCEIEDNCLWGRWSDCTLTHVDHLQDALECLQLARFDSILLNLTLPDSSNLVDTFLRVQAGAGDATLVVLCDEDDPVLAVRLIREGAQDVIVKSEIECLPLARAIRHGIERTRRLASLESRVFIDPLTGVQNRFGFMQLGAHYLKLARKMGTAASFLTIQLGAAGSATNNGGAADNNPDIRDLLLIRATEVSRVIFPEDTLIGRLQPSSLGLLSVGLVEAEAAEIAERLRHDLHSAFPDAGETAFVVIGADPGRWSSMEELLEDPVSCRIEHRARRNV